MSKRSAKRGPRPVTRRQQIEALRQVKGQEIASRVADNIREAVKQEVETQLKTIKDTMFDLIDRVVQIESNSVDRQQGEETPPISGDDEVVPEPGLCGEDPCSCGGHPDDVCW